MSDKKVFSINPELFSFSNTSKKKRKSDKKEKIKVRNSKVSNKNDTLRKRSILKMIREHHSQRNKDNFSKYEEKLKPEVKDNDFEAAKNFFKQMKVQDTNPKNYTIRKPIEQIQKPIHISSELIHNDELKPIPSTMEITDNQELSLNKVPLPLPKHGCLKNGVLPTYRQYMNQTRKTYEQENNNLLTHQQLLPSNSFDKANQMKQMEKLKNLKHKKRRLQKRTIRRTYKTGKSKYKPSISVLLTNKTLRNNVLEKEHKLKQVPIEEIKKYLIKHGFIKVGTTTPNDVLRKMYESALLICGEVQNYNSETLMYNFINNDDQL